MALVQRRNTSTRAKARDVEPDEADDEDERPTRSSRRAAKEPTFKEPETEEGLVDEEDEEDERPARRRGASKASFKKGAGEGSRRSRDEDDDDEPRGKSDAVASGWGAANKLKKEGGNFANEFQITKDAQLVAFLDDAPYAVYKQHWIDGGLRSTKKKSFICYGKGCPLCSIGENAAKKWAFNVAALEDGEWVVYSLIAGSRLFDNIADEHEGDDGPLNEGFWTLSKSGVKQSTTYKLKKVEGRKLESAADMDEAEVLESFEEADLTPYTAAQHQPAKLDYLQDIADELVGDDD